MRRVALAGALLALSAAPVLAQGAAAPKPTRPAAPAQAAKQPAKSQAAKTPAARSAAALAATREPILDEGTYQRISQAMLSYSALQLRGGWPKMPAGVKFEPGASGPHVALLRQRLALVDDLPAEKENGDVYDEDLVEAVKRFQVRHGLEPTGSVGKKTLDALNVPVQIRLRSLQASLDRLVGMNFLFAQRYVVVNLPSTLVEAVTDGQVERRHVVVVGSRAHPSPTLTTQITSVILNPTWTVPLSITKKEIIPHMRRDPSYLARMRMKVLDANDREIDPRSINWASDRAPNFNIRQDSGTGNALGSVKIDMPNPYSVYMHDTNLKNFFDAEYRFLSHGCTRVDDVREFAVWVLKDTPAWSRAQIDAGVAAGPRKDIRLAVKIPVAWVYLTGWMMKDGTIQFRDDIYGLDDDAPNASPTAEQSALMSAARAGGFVPPPVGQQPAAPQRPVGPVRQVSNLDSQ
jgi:murein L,D-transpeptidase YcbB/YkuD